MILRALHLENYKQYGLLDLEFREGLVGIIGRNGAGKSTIFEAILYCLFGRDEANKAFIRSSFAEAKANVVLTLQFAVGPVEYAVKREFRGKTMTVYADLFKNDQLVAKGVAAVNDEIARVLNMERDAFKRSVFSGQSELSELSKVSGEARKRMVRKMLGLDTLDEVQSRMGVDTRDLSNQIAGQRQNLLDPGQVAQLESSVAEHTTRLEQTNAALAFEQEKLQAVEAAYQSARQRFEEEERRQKHHQAIQQELGRLQERVDGLQTQQSALARKIAELEQQQEKLGQQKDSFEGHEQNKRKLLQLEAEQRRHLNRQANLSHLDELSPLLEQSRRRLEALDQALLGKQALEQDSSAKQEQLARLELEIEQKREAFNALKTRIDTLAARMDERRQKIQQLQSIGREGTCPTCFQPVQDAYDEVLEHLNQEIEQMQRQELASLEQEKQSITHAGQQLKSLQNALREALAALQSERNRLTEVEKQKAHEEANLKNYEAQVTRIQVVLREIGPVQFDEPAFVALRAQVEAREPLFLQFSNEQAYVARELPASRNAYSQNEAALAETTRLREARQAELTQTGFKNSRYEVEKQALTQFGDAFAAQSGRVRELERSRLECLNLLEQQREKLRANAQIQAQISSKLEEVEVLKQLSELLIQFKTEILEKVSPSISREASDLFSRITKGKYERILVDENFDFAIADGGQLYPIERFSGGEIDLANFCLRIAITKAIMELSGSGQGIEFLAFDEIFGSQDEERRQEMMLALHYLQEQFRQIYIVSHIESQKDYFPNLLEISYWPEGSQAKWV